MNINVQKTKAMIVCRDKGGVFNITINRQRMDQIESLNTWVNYFRRYNNDVKTIGLIALAKDAFNKRTVLLIKELSRRPKKDNDKGTNVASGVVWM